MEPKGSLPCSQAPVTGSYLDPDEFGPHLYTTCLPKTRFSIIFKLVYIFQVVISFPPYYGPISVCATYPAHIILLYLIILILVGYLVKRTNYGVIHYGTHFSLLLLPLS
jgi:hypothetical protein